MLHGRLYCIPKVYPQTEARVRDMLAIYAWGANRLSGSRVTRSSILVFVALLALSPVLKTLSEATSSDTIWALSFILLTLHTLLADYTAPRSYESRER